MIKKLVVAFCSLLLVAVSLLGITQVNAQGRDCDDNAIVRCGAANATELKTKLNTDITNIYTHYGIATSELDSTVMGAVRKDGTVLVNNKVVATNAVTAGRQNMSGSTYVSDLKIYERTPGVSFSRNELTAMVKMTNGQFEFAIIHNCGNPVRATPVPPKPVPPTPAPPTQVPPTPMPPAPVPPIPAPLTPVPPTPIPPKNPDVSIEKTVNKTQVILHEEFDYMITVKNTGTMVLKNAVITDNSPTGIEYIASTSDATTATKFTATVPELLVGASKSYAVRARAVTEMSGLLVNTACINALEISGINDRCASAQIKMVCAINRGLTIGSPDCKEAVPIVAQPVVSPPVPPKPEVKAAVAVTPAPVILPATGPADVVGIFGSTSIAGYIGSLFYRRMRRDTY